MEANEKLALFKFVIRHTYSEFYLGKCWKAFLEDNGKPFLQKVSSKVLKLFDFKTQKWGFGSKNFKVHESWPSRCHLKDFWKTKLILWTILLIELPKVKKIMSKFEEI